MEEGNRREIIWKLEIHHSNFFICKNLSTSISRENWYSRIFRFQTSQLLEAGDLGSTEVLSVLAKVHIRFETSPGLWDFLGFVAFFSPELSKKSWKKEVYRDDNQSASPELVKMHRNCIASFATLLDY